ncbi:MAG: L,D-transpeptidase family protein [Jiangellaceae bacterium]
MPGRPRLSRRDNRRRARRRLRLRRTLVLSTSALVGVALLGAFGAPSEPDRADVPASPAAQAAGDRPERERAAPARRTERASVPDAAVPPVATQTPEPPPGDAKPSATSPLPEDSGTGKRVVYAITAQQVWLVDETGEVARTYIVSGSKYDQVDLGEYEVFSASRHATSWHGTETMEYMVRFHRGARANIGFHDIPVTTSTGEEVQTLADLGTPLSDGCIRQDVTDAQALWDFAPVGTAVVVVA